MFAWRLFFQFFVADFRDTQREYVEGAARSFDDVWPDAAAFDERKPGMESILEFLGEEARLILARTTHSVWCFANWIWEPSAFPLVALLLQVVWLPIAGSWR